MVSLFNGCATTIPMSSNPNDFVMLGIKTNNSANVSYEFTSKVIDGETKLYTKDKEKIDNNHTAAIVTESATLNRMMKNYMESKFTKLNSDGEIKINIELQDFWLENYGDSVGKAILLGVNNMNTTYVANVKVLVTINYDGQELVKTFQSSADDTRSGQSVGQNAWENLVGRIINNANNKILMLLNAQFEELKL